MLIAVLMVPIWAAKAAPASPSAREQQWIYRSTLADGSPLPTAVFLSWNYDAVIFSATCDRAKRELVLRYLVPTGLTKGDTSLEIGSVELRTMRDGEFLEGRSAVTPPLQAILDSPADIVIDAPNDMGEPFYVGHAEPLRRIALDCR